MHAQKKREREEKACDYEIVFGLNKKHYNTKPQQIRMYQTKVRSKSLIERRSTTHQVAFFATSLPHT
jgi:hypothetical protein